MQHVYFVAGEEGFQTKGYEYEQSRELWHGIKNAHRCSNAGGNTEMGQVRQSHTDRKRTDDQWVFREAQRLDPTVSRIDLRATRDLEHDLSTVRSLFIARMGELVDGSLEGCGLLWFVTGHGDCPSDQELLVIESLLGGAAVDLRSLNIR